MCRECTDAGVTGIDAGRKLRAAQSSDHKANSRIRRRSMCVCLPAGARTCVRIGNSLSGKYTAKWRKGKRQAEGGMAGGPRNLESSRNGKVDVAGEQLQQEVSACAQPGRLRLTNTVLLGVYVCLTQALLRDHRKHYKTAHQCTRSLLESEIIAHHAHLIFGSRVSFLASGPSQGLKFARGTSPSCPFVSATHTQSEDCPGPTYVSQSCSYTLNSPALCAYERETETQA